MPGAQRSKPIVPKAQCCLGDGPMQSWSTYRYDYVPAKVTRPYVPIPSDNLILSKQRMNGKFPCYNLPHSFSG